MSAIGKIRTEMRKLRAIKKELPKAEGQLSLTDPDARSMNSAGKGTGTVGYNVQQIRDCQLGGMTPLVPRTVTSGARADGRFVPLQQEA